MINLWQYMEVVELANITQRDINDILTIASVIDDKNTYSVETKFDDIKILSNIVQKLGFRYTIISRSDKVEKDQEDHDITKR